MQLAGITFSEQRVSTPGIDWSVLRAGEGEPVLLLHGFPDSPAGFSQQVGPLLEQGYQLLLPWLPVRSSRWSAGPSRRKLA